MTFIAQGRQRTRRDGRGLNICLNGSCRRHASLILSFIICRAERGVCFFDPQFAAICFFVMQCRNRRRCGSLVRHFDKTKTARPVGCPVPHNIRRCDRPERREKLRHCFRRGLEVNISN
jgi:hypothetical protein